MHSREKLVALLIGQLVLCGLWAFGAWTYFHKQPLEACQQRVAALRRQLDATGAREELREVEVWLLRGDLPAAMEHLPRARLYARQAGLSMDPEFDDLDQMLCRQDPHTRERVALLASRFAQGGERRGPPLVCASRAPAVDACRPVAAAGQGIVAGVSTERREAAASLVTEAEARGRDEAAAVKIGAAVKQAKAKVKRERRHSAEGAVAVKKKRVRRKHGKAAVAVAQAVSVEGGAAVSAARAQLVALLMKRLGDVRACAAGADPGAASVKVSLVVNRDGQITSKKIETSLPGGVEDGAVRACVERILASIQFPTLSVAEVQVVHSWSWRIEGAAAASGKLSLSGSMEGDAAAVAAAKQKVVEALLKRQADIRACITSQVGRVNVKIQLTVNSQGQLTSKKIDVSMTTGDGEAVRTCVDRVISSIQFPSVSVPEVRVTQSWTWRFGTP